MSEWRRRRWWRCECVQRRTVESEGSDRSGFSFVSSSFRNGKETEIRMVKSKILLRGQTRESPNHCHTNTTTRSGQHTQTEWGM